MMLASIDSFLVILGIAVMLLLFTSFLLIFLYTQRRRLRFQKEVQQLREQQQNQLIEAAIRSEELERHRIAEQLHDEVGAILSSSKLHLQGIKTACLDERDKALYDKSKELLDDGIQKVRGISHNLHSNILKELGLNEAIRHFINKSVQSAMIRTTTELDDAYVTRVPENDISIYRLIQELVNNILKHARATRIAIRSEFRPGDLVVELRHDGTGLTQQQFEELRYHREGLGLKNIQNRVILLKGTITFAAGTPDNTITLHVPQNASAI